MDSCIIQNGLRVPHSLAAGVQGYPENGACGRFGPWCLQYCETLLDDSHREGTLVPSGTMAPSALGRRLLERMSLLLFKSISCTFLVSNNCVLLDGYVGVSGVFRLFLSWTGPQRDCLYLFCRFLVLFFKSACLPLTRSCSSALRKRCASFGMAYSSRTVHRTQLARAPVQSSRTLRSTTTQRLLHVGPSLDRRYGIELYCMVRCLLVVVVGLLKQLRNDW